MISSDGPAQSATIEIDQIAGSSRIHPIAGLVGCFLGLTSFVFVAASVERASLTQFDIQLCEWFHNHARSSPGIVTVVKAITTLGSTTTLTVFAAVVAIGLSIQRRRLLARLWLVGISGGLLHHALKALFPRLRPQFSDPFVTEASSSFPSGHAMASLIGYGLAAYLLWVAIPRREIRVVIVAAAAVLVLAIGFSRLYLGAHYLTDVAAGFAAGTVWLSAAISGIEMVRRTGRLDPPPARLAAFHSTRITSNA